jgi:dermatan 4-sulfotransferase 1
MVKAATKHKLRPHFILFEHVPIIYGRVPKVANSSIKAALTRLLKQPPVDGLRSTADVFWRRGTHGETSMINAETAISLRSTHTCFSFVRNPFDRLASAYNNKIIEIDAPPSGMAAMGLERLMSFERFLEIVCNTDDDELDVHLLPQSTILYHDGVLVPDFIGKLEAIEAHWKSLRRRLRQLGLPTLGVLPNKNVRRSGETDLSHLFTSERLISQVVERYKKDFELFYPDQPLASLALGRMQQEPRPIQRNHEFMETALI